MSPTPARLARALLVIALCLPVALVAELPFSFETTPGRLPKSVVPRHYDIRVQPDVDALTFTGSVQTEIEVLETTDKIVMNARNLEIDCVTFDGSEVAFTLNPEMQTLTLELSAAAASGAHTLTAVFRGTIHPQAAGLFFDKYSTSTGDKVMLGSQFEVADARQVFPCWDEPVFRATFDFTAIIPGKFMAVSNMPEIRNTVGSDGLRTVTFARTPTMSTYLLAFFAGEFEVLEGEHDGIALRIITTEDKRASGTYAMESTKRILAFMNDYFGVPYPLPKLDQIAIPNAFATFGAMENWGCISYIDNALLFDPATGSQSSQQSIFAVIAHEIAHQWFGNIVTMAWWDNLWLNEGFATWMGDKATEALNPGWDMNLRGANGKESAMSLDASQTTHAVQVVIPNENDAKYSFDVIAYSKGRAILHMLEGYIGEESFRSGVRDYIHSHQYSNTTTADLWAAFDRSSGRAVSELAAAWTDTPGFPVVHVSSDAHGDQIVLRQERFEIGQWDAAPMLWQIPVTIANTDNPSAAQVILLDGESVGVPMPAGEGAVKVNVGNVGFYRAHYEGGLAQKLNASAPALPAADQLNLLGDTWALVEAGMAPAPVLLDLIESLRGATESQVWSRILIQLNAIDRLAEARPQRQAFRDWAVPILAQQLEQISWLATPGEPPSKSALRSSLITTLGAFGHARTITECRRRFADYPENAASVPPDIRAAVLTVVGRHADQATYDKLHKIARETPSTIEKARAYRGMQSAENPALAAQTLALGLGTTMPTAIRTWNTVFVSGSGHTALAWGFTRENLDALLAIVPGDSQYDLVPFVMRTFNERESADELLAFVAERFPAAAMTEALKAADSIRRRANTRDRELPRIGEWLAAKGR